MCLCFCVCVCVCVCVCAYRFRALVKDLGLMMQNLINSIFKTVNTVEEEVRLLDIFRPMSTREVSLTNTHTHIQEKVEEVYNIFNKELKMVNKELNQRTRSTPDHMPRIAGQAHWLRALRHRLEGPMEVSPLDYIVIYSF